MNSMLKLFFVNIWNFDEDNTLLYKKKIYINIMKANYLYFKTSFFAVIIAIFSLYLTDCLARDISSKERDDKISISSYCDDSLQ